MALSRKSIVDSVYTIWKTWPSRRHNSSAATCHGGYRCTFQAALRCFRRQRDRTKCSLLSTAWGGHKATSPHPGCFLDLWVAGCGLQKHQLPTPSHYSCPSLRKRGREGPHPWRHTQALSTAQQASPLCCENRSCLGQLVRDMGLCLEGFPVGTGIVGMVLQMQRLSRVPRGSPRLET